MLHVRLRSSISSSLVEILFRTCWTLFLWAAFVRELGLQISRTPGLQEMLADTSPTLCLHLCLNLIGIYRFYMNLSYCMPFAFVFHSETLDRSGMCVVGCGRHEVQLFRHASRCMHQVDKAQFPGYSCCRENL